MEAVENEKCCEIPIVNAFHDCQLTEVNRLYSTTGGPGGLWNLACDRGSHGIPCRVPVLCRFLNEAFP